MKPVFLNNKDKLLLNYQNFLKNNSKVVKF